jgi:hypothetical protein
MESSSEPVLKFYESNETFESSHVSLIPECEKMVFTGVDGQSIAEIDLQDGTVTIHQEGKLPEAAKLFWDTVAQYMPGGA